MINFNFTQFLDNNITSYRDTGSCFVVR